MTGLTLFASPRPFEGVFDRIQYNAFKSWISLDPTPEVLVFGGDERTGEVCRELGLRWIPEIASARSGAPLLDALFADAQRLATRPSLAYVNPDIVLLQECADAIGAVWTTRPGAVVVAAPWNTSVPDRIAGGPEEWVEGLRAARANGQPPARWSGADLFAFPRGAFDPVPPLTIGRLGWDNWLLWRAATRTPGAVDITEVAGLIHQDHPGTTHRGGSTADAESAFAEEVRANDALIPWWARVCRRSEIPLRIELDGRLVRRFRAGRVRVAATVALRAARMQARPVLDRVGLWDALKKADERRHRRRDARR